MYSYIEFTGKVEERRIEAVGAYGEASEIKPRAVAFEKEVLPPVRISEILM